MCQKGNKAILSFASLKYQTVFKGFQLHYYWMIIEVECGFKRTLKKVIAQHCKYCRLRLNTIFFSFLVIILQDLYPLVDLGQSKLCTSPKDASKLSGAVVEALRGNCTFLEKGLFAQGAGARSLLVVTATKIVS